MRKRWSLLQSWHVLLGNHGDLRRRRLVLSVKCRRCAGNRIRRHLNRQESGSVCCFRVPFGPEGLKNARKKRILFFLRALLRTSRHDKNPRNTTAKASLEKLAKLIHTTALLLQTKAYLFWKNEPALDFIEFLQCNLT